MNNIGKKEWKNITKEVLNNKIRKACFFSEYDFSRGNDKDICNERLNLGRTNINKVLDAMNKDLRNTVFSYIPNTAEVSYFGMVQEDVKLFKSC